MKSFEFDFIEKAWNHKLFKSKIGELGYVGHDVFNHVYETTIKNTISNFNLELINRVKHSGGKLRHINTSISDKYAEITYLLIDNGYYRFIKYRIDIYDSTPYLTDIFSFKENRWFSNSMREVVLLNLKHTAVSPNRFQANQAFQNYQFAIENGDYEYAFDVLNQVPDSHQIFNDYKIARINTAAQLGDSLLLKVIEQENNVEDGNNIYLDYIMAFYLDDSIHKKEVSNRMLREIGISKNLLDSLNSESLVWD